MITRFFSAVCLLVTIGLKAQQLPENTSSQIDRKQAESALQFHNKVRKEVGVGPLEWSSQLASFAQAWANNLASSGCKLKHRPPSGKWGQQFGENIFFASDSRVNAVDASKAWYSEIKDFTYGKLNTNNWAKTGHYTQMVWRNTTQVGIGSATCPSGAIIIVANYNPRGNYLGEKPY